MRFTLATLLAVGVCAMTSAGHNSLTAIAEWGRRCDSEFGGHGFAGGVGQGGQAPDDGFRGAELVAFLPGEEDLLRVVEGEVDPAPPVARDQIAVLPIGQNGGVCGR
ncbi:hypothetical protein GCM10023080_074660 [Streptomyces pseudoechinosporeus]